MVVERARTGGEKIPSHRPKPLFTEVFALKYRPKVVPRAYLPRFLPSQRRATRWQTRIYRGSYVGESQEVRELRFLPGAGGGAS